MPSDDYILRLLARVASGSVASQRDLARDLGVALGLTNLLLRRLALKGWIRIVRIKPNRVLYLITPAGILAKARMSREYFRRSVTFYAETRDRIRQSFEQLAREENRRVVFFGAGEVAEVGYVCLGEAGLTLVAVVDDDRVRPFFGLPVRRVQELTASGVEGQAYDCVAVMSFAEPDPIRERLRSLGIPESRIRWLEGPADTLSPVINESAPGGQVPRGSRPRASVPLGESDDANACS